MKKHIYLILILFLSQVQMHSQTLSDENFIYTEAPQKPFTSANYSSLPASQKQKTVTYFDGLGRPMQTIAIGQGGNGEDIITPVTYDGFGRQDKDYLPYTASSTGAYRTDALTGVANFYNTVKYENTLNPYSQKQFEASPLNRVLQQAAPGNDWSLLNNRTIKMEYQTNIANEVKLFQATTNFVSGLYNPTLSQSTTYGVGQLYKTITKDENWSVADGNNKTTEEFKDKEGRVVLKRTYNNNTAHDTYYVYDVYGNLTYVLPPNAMEVLNSGTSQVTMTSTAIVSSGTNLQLNASQSITLKEPFYAQAGSTFSATIASGSDMGSILNDLCYQYKYDYRNRLVEKKLPGKQWEYIVYDKLDRVVATGPALAPFNNLGQANGWMITKYDAFNRPVLTAWMPATVTSEARAALQNTQNANTVNFSETKSAATDTTINGVSFRYSNVAWPTSGYHVLTVAYFDDYNYPNPPTIPTIIETEPVFFNSTVQPKGLPTGSYTRVLQASTDYANELAYSLYDVKGRTIRTYTKNFLGGYTYTDSKLDFTGKPEYTITYHKRLSSDGELKTKEVFTYSPQGRLLSQTHQIGTATPELLVENDYDELGQLKAKKVGANTQKIDYSYNIRGWLTEINKVAALQQVNDPKDLFAFKINYNTISSGIAGVSALYNGNIAETHWASSTDNVVRTYGYKYDALNRLNDALYKKGTVVSNAYDEKLTYDANGNIKTLTRYGSLNDTAPVVIDELTYAYKNAASNQLMKVTDTKANNANFRDEFKDSATNAVDDYDYDANGNMTKDNNKNITAITYNHLNLPTQITFGSAGNISYIYNATGQKVQKVVVEPGKTTITTDYLGGYQYSNAALKFFPTSEGYVEPVGNSYKYVYQYKDHLGNVRLSYDKTLAIQEENNYYPFGLKHSSYSVSVIVSTNDALKYRYNSKEYQDELGLNLYAYGYRHYDPAIGRWTTMDPLLNDLKFAFDDSKVDEDDEDEVYEALVTKLETADGIYNTNNLNPYGYGYNDPVSFDDPDGRCPWCIPILLVYLLTPETAVAPTGNWKNDGKAVGESKAMKGNILLSTAGAGLATKIASSSKSTPAKEKAVEKTTEKSSEKKVPNPNGKNGGQKHQEKINEYGKKLEQKGYEVTKERRVNTEGGHKNTRYTDITAKKDGKTLNVQVGKQNKNGTPVARERRAIEDINNSTKGAPNGSNRTIFVPYN
ncbi:hypothetical protein FVB9288_02237 [Flavobacterium sp. CECT 9288]|uniref:DUF6443 domain-containing protein n=1 Tax=Flavobacterium sp. CECT 9288 TaxID=2845819 RepID=UPI001E5B113B|nr:DUF6443 domain-containing protein [Flavobacterium sp. CECT 9288]CAH0336531.1 hypothetical protein FVB9288_02237 [Flavobacterium sp. CECT 9288]